MAGSAAAVTAGNAADFSKVGGARPPSCEISGAARRYHGLMMFRWFEKLVHPYPEGAPATLPKDFLAFVWACTRGLRGYVVAMTLLTAVIGAFEALLFAMMGKIVDSLAATSIAEWWSRERGMMFLLVGALLASILVTGLQTLYKHQALAGNFPMRLRWNFHRLMLDQSMGFYQDEFAGRIATKVMQSALAVRDFCLIIADILVYVVIYFLTMTAVLGGFNAWLLVPFGLWFALYGLAMRYFVPRLGETGKLQADARSLMTGRITDAYTNIATVKLFSHSRREADYARSAMQDFLNTVHRQMRLVSGFETCNQALSVIMITSTVGIALWAWGRGEVGVGAVAAATAMAMRLNGISHWIMWELASLFEQVGTVQDGIGTLSRPRTVVDRPDAAPLNVTRGEVEFENVTFKYGAGRKVIDDFSLRIRPGEKIGLVGRSGAGKSTIVNLLLRFYDIEAGRILIDGQDIAHGTQESLRAQIGMVTQDTSLLHRSVRDNIVYGRPDATDEQMMRAAERAEASEFIATLVDPKGRKGYDAHVGERGVKLSGGQRQRIAIARVMLKDAPILLLDEATSALDSEVEVAIQQSLYRLMEGKTVVAIAHRLSTIAAMDRLIVMDHGKIVEEGDHRSLLAHGGIYARLWAHQSGGFLGEEAEEAEGEADVGEAVASR
jgi:ATP-binding cassette subfamily B multidrug efflux pump